MKKVAFFLDNRGIENVDASCVEQGNPGIGGTEYLILLVSSLLSKRKNGLHIHLYMTHWQKISSDVSFQVIDRMENAIQQAEENGFDIFVLKHDADNIKKDMLRAENGMKFLIWCHVFVCYWELDYYANNSDVYKIVFVGREAWDLYRDARSFEKSTFIYNLVNTGGCRDRVNEFPIEKRGHVVTYVGNIVPYKGFHLLANAWPEIIREVPDAQLYVIGSGKLYDSSASFGSLGLAAPTYEKVFVDALCENGVLRKNVHLMGCLGVEKKDILLQTKVGVPNPSGITETFCLSAVELQAYGAKIATIKSPGYIDTVVNGKLYATPRDLAQCVVSLLTSNENKYEEAMAYFKKEFSEEVIIKKWENLLLNGSEEPKRPLINPFYRGKIIKECLRGIKKMGFLQKLPPLERFLIFIERNLCRKTTYMDSNLVL